MTKITARFIIEIAGKPQENVQKALEKFKQEFESEKDRFKVNECILEQAEFSEESQLYTGFLEVDAKFKDVSSILNFVADYTPTSIEIEDPASLELDNNEFAGVLNDVSSMLLKANVDRHKLRFQVNYLQKQLQAKTKK